MIGGNLDDVGDGSTTTDPPSMKFEMTSGNSGDVNDGKQIGDAKMVKEEGKVVRAKGNREVDLSCYPRCHGREERVEDIGEDWMDRDGGGQMKAREDQMDREGLSPSSPICSSFLISVMNGRFRGGGSLAMGKR